MKTYRKERLCKMGLRIEARYRAKMKRRGTIIPKKLHNVLVNAEDMHLLRYSVELSKVLGLRLVSFSRRHRLKGLTRKLGNNYVRLKLTPLELKLLYAGYVQQLILGDTDVKERTEYLGSYLGSKEAYKIQQQVAEHERLKAIHEYEEAAEDYCELSEEDFDMWRGR